MKARLPTPRQQQGGGGHVLGAPGKLGEFSEPPFPHLGSRVALPQRALNTEEVKGAGSGERHWVIRDQLLANCRLARSCSQGATSLQLLAACCQGEGQVVKRDMGLPGSKGVGSGSVRSTPRVWGPEPRAWFGKISRESYQMPDLPRGWGARKVCASPMPRLAWPNSNSTDSSRGMGGGPWQNYQPQGFCGPPAFCAASPWSHYPP